VNRKNGASERFENCCFSLLQLLGRQLLFRKHTVTTLSQLVTYEIALLDYVRSCFGKIDKLLWAFGR